VRVRLDTVIEVTGADLAGPGGEPGRVIRLARKRPIQVALIRMSRVRPRKNER
jgi:hypothetical protein